MIGRSFGFRIGMRVGPVIGLVMTLFFVALQSLTSEATVLTHSTPNEGAYRSMRMAMLSLVSGGLLVALTFVCSIGQLIERAGLPLLHLALASGVAFGLLISAMFGGLFSIKHF